MPPFNSIDKQQLLAYGLRNNQFPNPLFKYTTIPNLQKMLEGSTLKFSRITEFNDKRECFAAIDCNCSRADWANYIAGLNPTMTIPRIASIVNDLMTHPERGRQWITQAIKETNQNLGILCLSTENNIDLMWAHYADTHRGVCLEFDISQDLDAFCFPKEVIYDNNIRRYNYIKSWNRSKGMDAVEVIFHKSSDWNYEKEYRVVRIDGAGIVPFNIHALRTIIFGTDTPADKIADIRALCTRRGYTHIKFCQRILDDNGNFKIQQLP